MKIPGEYFTPAEERILYQEDLQEIEFTQRRLTAEGERFVEVQEWKDILTNIQSFRVLKMPTII